MKFKKKTTMLISLALGTALFASTAIAEIVSKSGYDVLKDSIKYTAKSATSTLSNYSTDLSFTVKVDGNVLESEKTSVKYDIKNNAEESTNISTRGKDKNEYYNYSDSNCRISKLSGEDTYYVTEFTTPIKGGVFTNPFEEEGAEDIEKIVDILVGDLKDAVIVTEKSDGGKELSGSLSESQIPALINALVSLEFKQQFASGSNTNANIPRVTKDIYVKNVSGKMLVNEAGLIETVNGEGTIVGKDENGKEHTMTLELTGKLYNVNSTVVKKPNLSGKKVEKTVQKDYSTLTNPEKYIGKYKNNMIIENNGKFEKIGERVLEITSATETSISGRYYEVYNKGYENYASNKKDFTFTSKIEENSFNGTFTATDASGKAIEGSIYLDNYSGKIDLNIAERMDSSILPDSIFNRIFE